MRLIRTVTVRVWAECRKIIIVLIAQIDDAVYRNEYIDQAAEVTGMDKKLLTKEVESLYLHMQAGEVATAHLDTYTATLAQDMLSRHAQMMQVIPAPMREQLLPQIQCSVNEHIRLYKEAITKKQASEKHQAGVVQLQSLLQKGTVHEERETNHK